jgi:hypothetical protein
VKRPRRCALILSVTAIGWSARPDPIIIRHDKDDSEYVELAVSYPAIVHLNLGRPEGPADGEGTLIAQRWVLTAAHVAVELSAGHRVTVGGMPYVVDTVFVHPAWTGQADDLALVRLYTPVRGVEPVPLYRGRAEAGAMIVIVGYGDFGTGLTGPVRNDGQVRAATNRIDEATDRWLKFVFDHPDSANATPLEGVSGPGDSGGPGFLRASGRVFLAGVSSAQSSRATGGLPGRYGVTEYYVRISSYLDWIDATLQAHGG